MKNLLFILITLSVLPSCDIETKTGGKTIVYTNEKLALNPKDTLILSASEYAKIQKLSQAAKDVAIYFIANKGKWSVDDHTFDCGKYEIWIASGYGFLSIYRPTEYEFNKVEKDYFWNMYKTYQRKEMRLYKYEEEIIIKTKN